MPEAGLSAAEVGKEIAEHLEKSREHEVEGRGRRISIVEAMVRLPPGARWAPAAARATPAAPTRPATRIVRRRIAQAASAVPWTACITSKAPS